MSLGANERQAFWDVTFPLARTGIVAGAIFAFAFSMDDVVISLFLSDPTTYTLPVALISMMRANFDLTIAAAAVMLIAMVGPAHRDRRPRRWPGQDHRPGDLSCLRNSTYDRS